MAFTYRKSVNHRLTQVARSLRQKTGSHLGDLGIYPGQEAVLKWLSETDGLSMSELAAALGVQPPTVTKMVTRLSRQGLVFREASAADGRLARVFLTPEGRACADKIDTRLRKLERDALAGIDQKDQKRLKKLLRQIERNLDPESAPPAGKKRKSAPKKK